MTRAEYKNIYNEELKRLAKRSKRIKQLITYAIEDGDFDEYCWLKDLQRTDDIKLKNMLSFNLEDELAGMDE